ncbi:MAG: hypothetical protein J1E29_06615, partial [Duncaniella sp.]|nr:hypothetical protein [Duncaniella sp.]
SSWLENAADYDVMTIADLKEAYWSDADNYYQTIGSGKDDKHILIKGRVISSDASGNIYKSLVIQDETAALAMSINQNSMCVKYRRGQELVLDVTGMTIGKYASLQQLGAADDDPTYGKQTTFMAYEVFEAHTQMNGLPDLAAIDTITVHSMAEIGATPAELRKWQSQMVRFNNVEFAEAGLVQFAADKETVNRTVTLEDGNSIIVRTSGYSNFWSDILPTGRGDIAGILSYHTSGGWQLLLIDREGCMNFGNPSETPGTEANPLSVDDAIAILDGNGSVTQVWTQGYIVGAVAPGVTSVADNSDIQFTATPELDNTLVIAGSADCKDYTKCLVISLPQGSKLREYGNLVDNPDNYGRLINLKGNLAAVLGTYGITGNQGTAAEFSIEGVDVPGEPGAEAGDGSEAKPYNVQQVISLGNPGTTAWVSGYIVGSAPGISADTFTSATGADASNPNVFIAMTPGETDYNKCVAVQLPSGAIRSAVSLQAHPENLGKVLTIYGSLEKYFGLAGIKTPTEYRLEGAGTDTPVTPPAGTGDGSKENPFTVAQVPGLNNPGSTAWVEGYIVGTAPGMSADTFTSATGADAANTNIFIADSPNETDYTKCVPVQLPSGAIRTALSLQAHPEHLGKKVKVFGSLEKYFGMAGVKTVTEYELDGNSGDTPVTPPAGTGTGTKDDPYSASKVMNLNNPGTTAWVEGYIVGSAPGMSADTFSPVTGADASNTNIFIADSPTETDYTKCVPVQLPSGTVRTALSLQAHPENLGKKVKVFGSLEKYFGMAGVKSTSECEFDGNSGGTPGGDTPVTPPAGDNDGTQDNPYTPSTVLGLNNPGTTAWVKGYIVGSAPGMSANTFSTATGADASNTNIFIADSPTETDYTKCVPVQLPSGAVRTALSLQAHPENLGKQVNLKGSLEKYFGVPGLKSVTEYQF